MKPWHRDGLAAAGLLFFVAAGFLVSVILGLLVAGASLILAAFLTAAYAGDDNGNR